MLYIVLLKQVHMFTALCVYKPYTVIATNTIEGLKVEIKIKINKYLVKHAGVFTCSYRRNVNSHLQKVCLFA